VHRGRPIFYSVGNFTFGSGNSRGAGMMVGLRFRPSGLTADLHVLYVKNRDPRVAYQPKVMRGTAATRLLQRLARASGPGGELLEVAGGRGRLSL
jgi:poly-gamma-glutamate capsule biosynthesis protein CapA/YwtB (metallophosphatase superfamily)